MSGVDQAPPHDARLALRLAARKYVAGPSGISAPDSQLYGAAIAYVAELVGSSEDNPDLTGGGSVAGFLRYLAGFS